MCRFVFVPYAAPPERVRLWHDRHVVPAGDVFDEELEPRERQWPLLARIVREISLAAFEERHAGLVVMGAARDDAVD